jgi:hypothetical protein
MRKQHATASLSPRSWHQCGIALVTGTGMRYDAAAMFGRVQPPLVPWPGPTPEVPMARARPSSPPDPLDRFLGAAPAVRELRQLLERMVLLEPATVIAPESLARRCLPPPGPAVPVDSRLPPHPDVPRHESARLIDALRQSGGTLARAARLLGSSRGGFRDRLPSAKRSHAISCSGSWTSQKRCCSSTWPTCRVWSYSTSSRLHRSQCIPSSTS